MSSKRSREDDNEDNEERHHKKGDIEATTGTPPFMFEFTDVLIGEGGYGKVYKVRNADGKSFAAKFFGYMYTEEPDLQWILREIDNLYHLRNVEGVGRLEATFWDCKDGYRPGKKHHEMFPVIVMENLSGQTLFTRIGQERSSYTEKTVALIFNSFIQTLKQIHHENLINIDLKTENLVFKDKSSWKVKIIDFGLAVHLYDRQYHISSKLMGTPHFVAPETLQYYKDFQRGFYSRASDIWQAACILYILLVGKYPFHHDKLHPICPGKFLTPISELKVSEDAKDLLHKMFEMNHCERISVSDILGHRWLTQTLDNTLGGEVLEGLATLNFMKELRGALSKHVDKSCKMNVDLRSSVLASSCAVEDDSEIMYPSPPVREALGFDSSQMEKGINSLKLFFLRKAGLSDASFSLTNCKALFDFVGVTYEEFIAAIINETECPHLRKFANRKICEQLDRDGNKTIDYFEGLLSFRMLICDNEKDSLNHPEAYFNIFNVFDNPKLSGDVIKLGLQSLLKIEANITNFHDADEFDVKQFTTLLASMISDSASTAHATRCRSLKGVEV